MPSIVVQGVVQRLTRGLMSFLKTSFEKLSRTFRKQMKSK